MYQPVLSRFQSRDPLSPNGADLLDDNHWLGSRFKSMQNTYGYGQNNPLRYVDPSGRSSQDTTTPTLPFFGIPFPLQAAAECGSFIWATNWKLDPREMNGLILQAVSFDPRVVSCDNPAKTPPCPVETVGQSCRNRKICPTGRYIELWKVTDGKVTIAPGAGENPTDIFAWFGCKSPCEPRNRTKGTLVEIGRAFFVADADWLPYQEELREVFNQGAEG